MGFFQKKPESDIIAFEGTVSATENLPRIPMRASFTVALMEDERITLANRSMEFAINKSQVTAVGVYVETETTIKEKSVIGRGLIGAAVAGPVGAVVGGLSGTKDKKKTIGHAYWYMCFTSFSGEACRIDMETFSYSSSLAISKFNKAVAPQNIETVQL